LSYTSDSISSLDCEIDLLFVKLFLFAKSIKSSIYIIIEVQLPKLYVNTNTKCSAPDRYVFLVIGNWEILNPVTSEGNPYEKCQAKET